MSKRLGRDPSLTPAQRLAQRRRENLDVFLGVLGFFTAMVLIVTVAAELRGEPALAKALILALLVTLVVLVLRMRRVLVARERASGAPDPHR